MLENRRGENLSLEKPSFPRSIIMKSFLIIWCCVGKNGMLWSIQMKLEERVSVCLKHEISILVEGFSSYSLSHQYASDEKIKCPSFLKSIPKLRRNGLRNLRTYVKYFFRNEGRKMRKLTDESSIWIYCTIVNDSLIK